MFIQMFIQSVSKISRVLFGNNFFIFHVQVHKLKLHFFHDYLSYLNIIFEYQLYINR